jgi:proline iminopeptidase
MCKIALRVFPVLFLIQLNFELSYAQSEEIIETEGSKIYYQTFGKGVPLLIINGGPGMSSEGFVSLAKKLAENNQTIIYDQRGTGYSVVNEINSNTITMDLMVSDMEELRKYLGIRNWIVMGHSFGGILAYYYTSLHPDKVIGLIQSSSAGMDLGLLSTLDITGGLTDTERDSLAFYNEKISNGDTSYETRLKRGKFLAPAYLYNRENIPVIAERLTQGNSRINGIVWRDLQRIGYDTKETLKDFEKPVLIIHCKQDVAGTGVAVTAHDILPGSKLVILDRCKHYGWLDRPEAYFNELREFLNDLNSN